jgi:type I restriction enzyme S subunit
MPGGVSKLREIVLTSAIQGKLVPQDSKDESAEILIKAIAKEKQMKNWPRAWKIRRILEVNPEWTDLYLGLAR